LRITERIVILSVMRNYSHISLTERELISLYQAQGKSVNDIGRLLNRSASTISRELKKNAPPVHKNYYVGYRAHQRSKDRTKAAHKRPRLKNDLIRDYVENKLKLGWSPEQISGRLGLDHPGNKISHEAIYQYIYKEQRELIRLLPRAHKKRQKRGHTRKHRNSHIPNRVPIENRPESVDARIEAGHWESDTLGSRLSKAALVVNVERKTRVTLISKIDYKTAFNTKDSIIQKLSVLPKKLRQTITYDNGYENSLHENVSKALQIKSYFCAPNASWQKGTVENTNGLIRRFFPKKTDFLVISDNEVQLVEFLLNNRPRKCLNYLTPYESLLVECCT
jgi:transposase, IS30 family